MVEYIPQMEYQKAIQYLYELVREGKLTVGSKIPSERDLAEATGIGRNSTREAISILRGMGLIESKHGSGNYVSGDCGKTIKSIVKAMLSLGKVRVADIVEFRKGISHAVCMLLLERGIREEDEQRLQEIVKTMREVSTEEFAALDRAFHMGLIRATRNELFIMIMEPIGEIILEETAFVMEPDASELEKLAEAHDRILTGIKSREQEACRVSMTEHYRLVEARIR